MTEQTITMKDGVQLYSQSWAATESKATILIVHGISEHSGRWQHVGEHFASLGFDVQCYDQRAHGRSGDGVVDTTDFALFLDDLGERVQDLLALGRPVVLYGHSMGGLIVTAYLESERPMPAAAVLSAPALSAEVPAIQRFLAKILSRIAPRFALKSSINGEHLCTDPSVGEAYAADPLVYLKVSTRFANNLFVAMDTTSASLDAISVPTLVLHGGDDPLILPAASEPLAALPCVTRVTFDGMRHEIHNEPSSGEVFDTIQRWLDAELGLGEYHAE